MKSGRDIYQAIKAGRADIADLTDGELAALLGHLGRKGSTTGTAGRIFGECLVEASARFMQATEQAREGEVSALTDFVTTDPDA
jgi:hypothetical protein